MIARRRSRAHGITPAFLLVAAPLVVAACGGVPPGAETATASGPNVLLISIDTLRADHLGAYGYARDTSPRIDALAADGAVFESHISSTSWTLPAHAAIFTSLPDSLHGAFDTDRRLDDAFVTLAERFRDAGYGTAGFFAGPYLHPAFGLAQGFERYVNCTSYAATLDEEDVQAWAMDADVMRQSHRDITNPTVLAAFDEWLGSDDPRPFFAFVHLWDTHFDFVPPAPYDTRFDPDYDGAVTGEDFLFDPAIAADMAPRDLEHLIALYDGEIAWTDEHVGAIVDRLQQRGLLEDTVIAITSDHGTEFFEHGNKGHRTTLFDELIRVPFVLRYPAAIPAGTRVTLQSRSVDIGPTLLELAGLPAPQGILGGSLVPLALGQADRDQMAVSELFSVGQQVRTLRTPQWKFYDVMSLQRQLWTDLSSDPGEQRLQQVTADNPGQRLLQRYAAIAADLDARRERLGIAAAGAEVPEEVQRQLRALGYIR